MTKPGQESTFYAMGAAHMSRLKLKQKALFYLLSVAMASASAWGCPKVDRLVDFNCDQKIKMVFTGDSIVRGTRDTRLTKKGYPGRLQDKFSKANVVNLGVPGNSTRQLYSGFKRYLKADSVGPTYRASRAADYFFIEVGTNDWETGRPDLTVRNIGRLVEYLRTTLRSLDGTAPMVVVATITPNVREFNAKYARDVNRLLLAAKERGQLPVFVRADDMPRRFLNEDGLHPDPIGYDFLAKRFSSFIRGNLQRLSAKLRKDNDNDGIYDVLEQINFGTSPRLNDTDGDGVSDGDEVFLNLTDPLVPDI